MQDPEAIANWPLTLSRDGARTPMPWQADAPQLGFSTAPRTWLTLGPEHRAIAVSAQEADPDSLLTFTRGVLRLRSGQAALLWGDTHLVDAGAALLVFERRLSGERLRCVFNLSAETVAHTLGHEWHIIASTGLRDNDALGPYAGYVASLVVRE